MFSLSGNSPFHRLCKPHISSSSQSHRVPIFHACSAAPLLSPPAEAPHTQCSQSVFLRPIVTVKCHPLAVWAPTSTSAQLRLAAWAKHLQQYMVSPELKGTYPPGMQSLSKKSSNFQKVPE